MNTRLGRFISTIRLAQVYNMTFSAQPPSDMRFQIARRTLAGNNSDWIAVRIYYPVANAIVVTVNGSAPSVTLLSTDSSDVTDYMTVCGANKYFYENGTISFIVTGDMNCQVRVTLTSNVQVTSRLMVPIDQFYSNGGVATFIDMMCAYLNITTDRLKVAGVTSGSTIVNYFLLPLLNTTVNNSMTSTPNVTVIAAQLKALLDMIQNAAPNTINLGSIGAVLTSTGQLNIINTDGSQYVAPPPTTPTTVNSSKTTIIIAVVVSIMSLALVGVTTYLVIRKLRLRERIEPEDSEDRSFNDIEIHKETELVRSSTANNELIEKEILENRSGLNIVQK
jgi:hypothetical protein